MPTDDRANDAFEPADPHRGRPILHAGTPLEEARAAVVLLHGRGAGARDILGLAAELDPHVPWKRVEETAEVLRRLGAEVETERFPGLSHTIARREIVEARRLLAAVADPM